MDVSYNAASEWATKIFLMGGELSLSSDQFDKERAHQLMGMAMAVYTESDKPLTDRPHAGRLASYLVSTGIQMQRLDHLEQAASFFKGAIEITASLPNERTTHAVARGWSEGLEQRLAEAGLS